VHRNKGSFPAVLAIQAAGKLKIQEALPFLLARVQEGAKAPSRRRKRRRGWEAKAVKALHDLCPKVAPGLRRYIASRARGRRVRGADHAALGFLQDSDPGVVEATVRSLIARCRNSRPPSGRRSPTRSSKCSPMRRPPCPRVRRRPRFGCWRGWAMSGLRKFSGPAPSRGKTPELRIAALQGLGKLGPTPGKAHLKMLFAYAAERDFRIAAPPHDAATSNRDLQKSIRLARPAPVRRRHHSAHGSRKKSRARTAPGLPKPS